VWRNKPPLPFKNVAELLTQLLMPQHIDSFEYEGIDLELLMEFTDADLYALCALLLPPPSRCARVVELKRCVL
jgi:hypothetical protein